MKQPPQTFSKALRMVCAVVMLATTLLPALLPPNASAAQITARSLTLVAGASDGGSKPGGVVNHMFGFSVPSSVSVGSIKLEYCTTAAAVSGGLNCDTPTGLVTTSATIGSQSFGSAFTLVNTTNGAPYLTRAASALTAGAYTVQLNSITNPTAVNGETFFVRISTFTSTDATTGETDNGTVTAATNRPIIVTGTMPESLVFCTGQEVDTNLLSGVPDCSTVTTGNIAFNQLFSPTDTAITSSQMAASTNAGTGYVIKVHGNTLQSGGNSIAAMASGNNDSAPGTSQFGMNLKANTATSAAAWGEVLTTPATYPEIHTAEVTPASNGTNYRGQATTGYNGVDEYIFNSTDTVADSAQGGPGGTDAQIFTVNYIVNVPGSQPAGTYTTTLTYICTPTF